MTIDAFDLFVWKHTNYIKCPKWPNAMTAQAKFATCGIMVSTNLWTKLN